MKFIILILLAVQSWAATYYVATTGNDANPGTLTSPFRHLTRGATAATSPGDTVIVMDGTYDNEGVVADFVVTLNNSGTAGNPITFRAQNRGGAILDSVNTSTNEICNGAAAYWDLKNASFIVIQGFVITRACDAGFQSNDAAHDITIRWNEIKNIANHSTLAGDQFGRDGIFLNASEYNFIFDGNVWHDIGRTSGPPLLHYDHGIYAHADNVTIINNVFYNMNRGWSIQLADGANNWTIANNTFSGGNANGDEGQIMFWNLNTNIAVSNNIFYSPTGAALNRFTATISATFTCNIIFGTSAIMSGGDTTGITPSANQLNVNPVVVNAGTHDYRLQSTSPAINTGTPVTAVTIDITGAARSTPPDVGAYEFFAAPPIAAANAVYITELTGVSQTGRPFKISRVFANGEIANFSEPRVNGVTPSAWQVDVKTRYPNGSLRHAIISFRSNITATTTVAVSFVNNVDPCSSGNQVACWAAALDQTGMLNFNAGAGAGAWRARIQGIAGGNTRSAEARTMMQAGKWTYWLRGPVLTEVVVEDKTTALGNDFGWQCTANCTTNYATATWAAAPSATYDSLHPIFVVGFYAGYAGVEVDYTLENPWSHRLQDQRYDLTITRNSPETNAYTQAGVTHWARGRWHKKFWNGTTPGKVKTDFNLPYLIESRVLPSFDTTKVVPASTINSVLTRWAGTDKATLMGNYLAGSLHYTGFFQKLFPGTGGREEIGLFPTWVARYLYTFHATASGDGMTEMMLGNADLIGQAPIHTREGDPNVNLKFCALSAACVSAGLQTIPAFSLVRSRDAWPLGVQNGAVLGTLSSSHNFNIDVAHQASMAYIPYVVTGEYYYLQELNYWGAMILQRTTVGTNRYYFGHNDWTYIYEQVRGMAWGMRNVGHAAVMNPDGSPEKAYFTQKLLNNIAIHEGKLDVRAGGYGYTGDNVKWQWGFTEGSNVVDASTPTTHRNNPLNWFGFDNNATLDKLNTALVSKPTNQWQIAFVFVVISHLEELGFPFGGLKAAMAKNFIHQLQDPAFNPYLIDAYRTPAIMTTGTWSSTWPEVKSGFIASEQTRNFVDPVQVGNADSGYVFYARAAASWLPGLTDGAYTGNGAYAWFNGKLNESLYNSNPKWAIIPRVNGTPPVASCDLTGDGIVNNLDVTLSINNAITQTFFAVGDLDGDGNSTVVDTQRVVNAALGNACVTGP